jgi:hypothetical protein
MTLGEIFNDLDALNGDLCIVARRPWTVTSDAMLVRLGDEGRVPAHVRNAGYEYFIEVGILRDEVYGGRASSLNASERSAVAIYYAEHDAFPEWFNEQLRS